tara:strand:+ start:360 stop:530 length:171 start_codon:yes stop_codon:yes gene_type:complete
MIQRDHFLTLVPPVQGIFWGNGRKCEGIAVFFDGSAELPESLCPIFSINPEIQTTS